MIPEVHLHLYQMLLQDDAIRYQFEVNVFGMQELNELFVLPHIIPDRVIGLKSWHNDAGPLPIPINQTFADYRIKKPYVVSI